MKSNPVSPQTPCFACRPHSSRAAFSLIETALALGIVAFAFVGLMGMLPAGLTTFRKSVDTTVSAQIVQHIVSDAEQSDFDALSAQATVTNSDFYVLKTRYFDDQGSEVVPAGQTTPSATDLLRILYHVRVRGSQPGPPSVTSDGGSTNFTSLPQMDGGRFHPRDSTFLTIQIANNPANLTLEEDGKLLWKETDATKRGVTITTQSAVVTRNGPSRNGSKKK